MIASKVDASSCGNGFLPLSEHSSENHVKGEKTHPTILSWRMKQMINHQLCRVTLRPNCRTNSWWSNSGSYTNTGSKGADVE
ncbi:Uncharacterized protein HZ326_29205 [Fusarium oxysporum f. sp. albedinis]|nr:Uncharacterized protein HZ326_29205 [Fusarium oxysporum f. sp. albedinis]